MVMMLCRFAWYGVGTVAITIGVAAFVVALLQQSFKFVGKTPPAFAHAHFAQEIFSVAAKGY